MVYSVVKALTHHPYRHSGNVCCFHLQSLLAALCPRTHTHSDTMTRDRPFAFAHTHIEREPQACRLLSAANAAYEQCNKQETREIARH